MRLLRFEPEFTDYFLFHLLTRTAKVEAALVDRWFSSSEMRLARALRPLANFGEDLGPEAIPIEVNHGLLAEMVGTTRSRVNVFMNKFRKLGLINYNNKLEVKRALLNFVLNQKNQSLELYGAYPVSLSNLAAAPSRTNWERRHPRRALSPASASDPRGAGKAHESRALVGARQAN